MKIRVNFLSRNFFSRKVNNSKITIFCLVRQEIFKLEQRKTSSYLSLFVLGIPRWALSVGLINKEMHLFRKRYTDCIRGRRVNEKPNTLIGFILYEHQEINRPSLD